MDVGAAMDRVRAVATVRADQAAASADIEGALRAASELRSWLAASEADLTGRLAAHVSFPERAVADCTRSSLNDAIKAKERSDTLDAVPSFADALDAAAVTPAHVDAITRAGKPLDEEQRTELFDRVADLVDVASAATVEEFRRRLSLEVRSIQADDGMARLERQRRATRLRMWTDGEGMWRFDGRVDPVLGVQLAAKLDAAVEALFAEAVPATCPTDPVEKQAHLRALAWARLVSGEVGGGAGARPGRAEYVVVIDASQSDGADGPLVDWGIPVEIPHRVLADMTRDGEVTAVVVRNGVVVHAPGTLDLGRTTRLASRAQRRALRGLYRSCAIPGCEVRFDRCKLHHVVWWRHGGRTDLDNLLPICTTHHAKVHHDEWEVDLGPNRELTVRFPDGTIHNTGPPSRRAA